VESSLTSGSYEQAYVRGLCKSPFLKVGGNSVCQITAHQHIGLGRGRDIRLSSAAFDVKVEDRKVDSVISRSITYLDFTKGQLDRPIKALDTLQPSFEDLTGVFDIWKLATLLALGQLAYLMIEQKWNAG